VQHYVSKIPAVLVWQRLNNEHYYEDHYNDASQTAKKSGDGMKVEKGEFLLDDVNSVMTTMRRAELSAYWAALNVSFSKHRYTPLPAPRTGQRLNFATGLNVQTKLAKYRRMTAACGVTVGR